MDTQPIPEPTPVIPPGPEAHQPLADAVPPPPPAPKVSIPIIIAVVATAMIVSGVFFGLSRIKPKEVVVAPTPTPTPIATPTPIRQPSAFASQPDFLKFQTAVATLSAAIAGYSPNDPSLTPPTLVLPLGFGQ